MASSAQLQHCREVFGARGWGGLGEVSATSMKAMLKSPTRFDVLNDLVGFTGMQPRASG